MDLRVQEGDGTLSSMTSNPLSHTSFQATATTTGSVQALYNWVALYPHLVPLASCLGASLTPRHGTLVGTCSALTQVPPRSGWNWCLWGHHWAIGKELMKKCLRTYVPHFVSLKGTERRAEGCQTGLNNTCPLDGGTQELNIFSFSLWLMGLVINAGRKLLF